MYVVVVFIMGILTGLIGYALAGSTSAVDTSIAHKRVRAEANLQSFTWYDGDQQRTVWLDPARVAEFGALPAEQSAVKLAFPDAKQLVNHQAQIRVWKLNGAMEPSAAMDVIKRMPADSKLSPVFHDVASTGGSKRALPGNVIVQFDPTWDKARIKRWLRDKDLQIVRKAIWGDNVYVIKTGVGFEALETANRLYESGEVVAASPDWWIEVERR